MFWKHDKLYHVLAIQDSSAGYWRLLYYTAGFYTCIIPYIMFHTAEGSELVYRTRYRTQKNAGNPKILHAYIYTDHMSQKAFETFKIGLQDWKSGLRPLADANKKSILFGSASPKVPDTDTQVRPPIVTATEFHALEDATNWYLTANDYGVPEVEAIMAKIFDNNHKGPEAIAWAKYWTELNKYEEKVKDGVGSTDLGQAPKVHQVSSNYVRFWNISVDAA